MPPRKNLNPQKRKANKKPIATSPNKKESNDSDPSLKPPKKKTRLEQTCNRLTMGTRTTSNKINNFQRVLKDNVNSESRKPIKVKTESPINRIDMLKTQNERKQKSENNSEKSHCADSLTEPEYIGNVIKETLDELIQQTEQARLPDNFDTNVEENSSISEFQKQTVIQENGSEENNQAEKNIVLVKYSAENVTNEYKDSYCVTADTLDVYDQNYLVDEETICKKSNYDEQGEFPAAPHCTETEPLTNQVHNADTHEFDYILTASFIAESDINISESSPKMDGGAQALLFKSITKEEYETIDVPLREKIESVLNGHIEDYLTAKSCFETTRSTQEGRLKELDESLKNANQERDELKIKVEALTLQYEDTNKRLTVANIQLNKLREECKRLEKTVDTVRRERDDAIDEKQISANALERRELEVERLRNDVTALNADLRAAVVAKCEAVMMSEDVQAKQIELEMKEVRFESERTLLNQQIVELTADLTRVNEELMKHRRDSTTTNITLQTKIAEKEEELRISNDKITKLQQINDEATKKMETLTQKLQSQIENEDSLIETFQNEMRAKTKLADLYKERLDESENRSSELSAAVKEFQRLLQEASEQYGVLETKLAQQEQDMSATIQAKQEAINALKEELRHANILLEAVKQESSEAAVSRLSPMAASASKLLKSGLTLTQLYTKFAEVTQELIVYKNENEHLNNCMAKIYKEIEEKAELMKKQEDEHAFALSSLESMTKKVEDLETEMARFRRANTETEATSAYLARENKRLTGSINDLGRQVCFLLREVEVARGNQIPLQDSPDKRANAFTTSEVIAKHLVTFKDLQDLQLNNQKLLVALREISADRDEVEMGRESEKVLELKGEIERAEAKIEDLIKREKFLESELDIIRSQRDIYQRLFKQHVKPGTPQAEAAGIAELGQTPEKLPQKQDNSSSNISLSQAETDDAKSLKVILEELKKEYETYRNERKTNEVMLNESLNKLREELSESVRVRSELGARAEYMDEKCKALAKRVQSLTTEVEASEKRCANYVATIGKLEGNLQHTRTEAMNAMSKLSVAEVTVSNLKQENQLLRDNERRLQMEREAGRKEKHGQELLMANLEALKAKFDNSEGEARIRLEQMLDNANRECTALRRRLQEEQDRLTRRVELLEEQTKTAKERLEEERALKENVMEQLEASRQEVKEWEQRLEEMSSQLNTAINKSQPVLDRENRIKELEGEISRKDATIKGLNEQVTLAKKCQSELSEVSLSIEKQLSEVTEQYEQHKEESDRALEELRKTESELRTALHNLEMKLKTSDAAETENRAQREAELTSLRSRVETLSKELDLAKTNLTAVEKEGKEAVKRASEAQEKATAQVLTNDKLLTDLEALRTELSDVKSKLLTLANEKESIAETYKLEKEALEKKVLLLEETVGKSDEKIAELTKVNDLLQDQLQELGIKVSVLDTSRSVGMDLGDEGITGEGFRESDKILEVMRFLRKEKSSAISQAEALKSEKLSLQAEVEVLRRQLEESRKALEQERSSSDTPAIAAERHAQLLSKVETLNQLTENNKALREDRDRLLTRANKAEAELKSLEAKEVAPAKSKIAELEAKIEQLITENTALTAENQRWQERANQLIERTNKNPDELKKLTQEKENLTKQLGLERDQSKLAKTKLEDQIAQLRKEKDDSINAHSNLEKQFNITKNELTSAKESEARANEKILRLEQDIAAQESALNEIRNKEMQIRQIAKKYKSQYQELSKTLEDKNKASPANPEIEERLKTLTEQTAALEAENETLRRENEGLKASVVEREDRAKTLLKNARSRIQHLQEENKALAKEVNEGRARRGGAEGTSAENRLYEGRISRLEKEKEEEQAEKERLGRELEVMTQRMNIIQRQLDKQQGNKPSTSSGEKTTSDPPTANIKPMGPSTPTTKQVQPQQAVTVTPWRETPFASIRPMSQQARTVVVLPTSQSSSSNQPVLVAPQQQVVHTSSTCEGLSSSPTSSHLDYMPATSSAVHNIHQATVIIGQHMEAELIDGEEIASQPPTHLVQPNQNVSIALVLPQPAPQQQDQAQAEAASAENSSVVSASNQEQVSEQSVSASNHGTSAIGPTYYRAVDESTGPVASSQQEGSSSMASGSSNVAGSSGVAASNQQAASSTTSVTTPVAPALKRPMASQDDLEKHLPPNKRSRLLASTGEASGEMLLRSDGLEVEYQVPTSSQRDQEDDVLVISDEDDMPDDGVMEDGQEFEEETEEESRYAIEAYGRDGQDIAMSSYEVGGPDIDEGSTIDHDNNEVDIIDDSSEVPNQCESSRGGSSAGGNGNGMEGVATTGGGEATSSLGSTTTNQVYQGNRRPTSVPVRHHMILSYEDPGDDSIVPSTPTLFVPRRTDGYGEAVSSPHVPTARFTFSDSGSSSSSRPPVAGVAQVASEGMDDTRMDLSQLDEGTGRSVPTTPSHVSPQDPNASEIGQSSVQDLAVPGGSGVIPEVGLVNDPGSADPKDDANNEENGDGVSSETEKPLTNPPSGIASPDPEEEGREAEASPTARSSTSSSTSTSTLSHMSTRSSSASSSPSQQQQLHHQTQQLQHHPTGRRARPGRGGVGSQRANPPTPIVWDQPEPTVSMVPIRDFFYTGGPATRNTTRSMMGRGVGSSGGNVMEVRVPAVRGRGARRSRGGNQPFQPFHGSPGGGGSFQGQPRFS